MYTFQMPTLNYRLADTELNVLLQNHKDQDIA